MPDGDKWNPVSVDVASISKKLSKIRLRGGVVGKLSTVLIFAALGLAGISWSVGNVYVSGGCALALASLVYKLGMRMMDFADKNPQAALFEGAELLVHEQMKLGMKGTPEIEVDPGNATTNPASPPKQLPLNVIEQADSSDPVEEADE